MMSGNLYHAQEFRKEMYRSRDGTEHYELVPEGGDYYSITNHTWGLLITHGNILGIEETDWPVFENSFDLPLDMIEAWNLILRRKVEAISLDRIDLESKAGQLFLKIIEWIRSGERVFFCKK